MNLVSSLTQQQQKSYFLLMNINEGVVILVLVLTFERIYAHF